MNTQSFKTFSARPRDIDRDWHIVDAADMTVGRLASRVAHVLRGKHKPIYTPHMDTGDFVVIVNAEKVRFSGQKETQKTYRSYSGYPGGEKELTPAEVREDHPKRIITMAVKGMLPKNKLGRRMLEKLKVHVGPDHPHQAQQPTPLEW
ncbi:MAG: 50S ribosomal protein L13 [Longimonas sp.]|uniref:50S ribosomal protein L13 n=1 Tax=Longimonas sp. TaxID=2039626 RepID=UPI0033547CB6